MYVVYSSFVYYSACYGIVGNFCGTKLFTFQLILRSLHAETPFTDFMFPPAKFLILMVKRLGTAHKPKFTNPPLYSMYVQALY